MGEFRPNCSLAEERETPSSRPIRWLMKCIALFCIISMVWMSVLCRVPDDACIFCHGSAQTLDRMLRNMSANSSSSFWDMLTSHTKVAGGTSPKQEKQSSTSALDDSFSSTWTDEKIKSFKACIFITTCARKLDLNSITKCTSCWLFHKFYCCVSIDDYDEYTVAMASIFLAGKIEDTPLKIRDVINVAYRTMYPDKPILQINNVYSQLVDTLVQFELFLCRMLRFQLSYDNPHKYLLHYLRSLTDWMGTKPEEAQFCRMAWCVLNDCYYTKLCTTSKPDHLAVTACYVAIGAHNLKLPLEEHAEKTWWQVFVDDIKLLDITVLAAEMLEIYENEKVIK